MIPRMTFITQFLWRWLYTLLFTLSIPAILLRLWWRGRKNKGYRTRWLERFGIFKAPLQQGGIWIHAVSLGESIAATPLIRQIKQKFPNLLITVTTTTPTGSSYINKTFQNEVFHVYFPYDLPWCIHSFLNRIKPSVVVIMETELWPNCLWGCYQQNIPVLLANGCLSLGSLQGYHWISPVTRMMLKCITKVLAQTELDGTRFLQLGLNPKQLQITGNMKFDIALKEGTEFEAQQFRQSLGSSRLVWVAASTHAGEEDIILDAFAKIRLEFPELLLILVPRHPERFATVAELLKNRGFSSITRSSGLSIQPDTAVYLGDTLGELNLFYAAADIAFVGGSLAPIGGHNILEPAAWGVPMLVGFSIENIIEVTDLLLSAGALIKITDSDSLAKAVLFWLSSMDARQQAGLAAKKVVAENRGAVTKIAAEIETQMNRSRRAV